MAINFYKQPKVQAPSKTNIVRAQAGGTTIPSGSAGNFRALDQYLSGAAGAPTPSTLTQSPVRQTLSAPADNSGGGIDINQIVSDALSGINFGLNWPTVVQGSGSSSGTGQAAIINANTAAQRLLYDQATAAAAAKAAQDAAARARLGTGAQADALKALLATPTGPGSYREGADALLAILAGQEATGRQSIADQYAAAQKLLGEQYGRATTQTTAGYDALKNYLAANAPQAYAQTTPTAAPTVNNALAQYMQAQGAQGAQATTAQEVAAQNAAAQAGQGNYAGLLDVLRRQETAGQASRQAEEQMARTTAGTALEALRAQAGAGLTQQQQTALDTLVNQITGQRFGVEQGATQRKQELQDALTALLGTGYNVTGEQIAQNVEQNVVPAVSQTNPEAAKNRVATTDWQKLVQSKQPTFTGTWNEAKKKFPKLYADYLKTKKKA